MPYSKVIKLFNTFLIPLLIVSCRSETADVLFPANEQAVELYNNQISTILESKCISCHQGYHSGSYGDYNATVASLSQIIERINANDNTIMPPSGEVALTAEELELFDQFLEYVNSDGGGSVDNEVEEEEEEVAFAMSWTAYKYPDRFSANREGAGVGGTFNEIEYSFNTNYSDIIDILDGATVNINTSSVNVADNEPLRTGNVGLFFAAFTPDIVGTVTSYTETEVDIEFEMNGISEEVTFEVEVDEEEGLITLSGSIETLEAFNWQAGYDAIQEVCGELHEGTLWPDVSLEAVINVNLIEQLRERASLPVDVSWTAYKYPDRFENNREGAGVGGTFNRFEYSFNDDYNDLVDVLDGATINIATSSVNVADNEPTRTENVGMFFAAFTPDITGAVVSYTDTTADIEFSMNGISDTVTLDLEVDEGSNTLTLSGAIEDMAVFDWGAGYDALEVVCGALHEGMLWEDVDISVTIKADEL